MRVDQRGYTQAIPFAPKVFSSIIENDVPPSPIDTNIKTSISREPDPVVSELNRVGKSFNLTGLINPISSAIGSLINWFSTERTNRKNEALMREQWGREDTAFQRKVADLKAAGLNPKLAVGSSGSSSGSLIQFRSPAVDAVQYDPANRYFDKLTAQLNVMDVLSDLENKTLQRELMKTSIDKNVATIEGLNLKNESQSIKNIMLQLDVDYYKASKIFSLITQATHMIR